MEYLEHNRLSIKRLEILIKKYKTATDSSAFWLIKFAGCELSLLFFSFRTVGIILNDSEEKLLYQSSFHTKPIAKSYEKIQFLEENASYVLPSKKYAFLLFG